MAPLLHRLSLLDIPPYPPNHIFTCNLCREIGHGPLYHCSLCDFNLHRSCAATSEVQDHFSHDRHPLHLTRCCTERTCDGCGLDICTYSYACEECEFDLHPTCVKAPRFIIHPLHRHHPLALKSFDTYLGSENGEAIIPMFCDSCKMPLHHQCYACTICKDFYLHQFCSTISVKNLDCNLGLKDPSCLDIIHEVPEYSAMESRISSINFCNQEALVQNNATTRRTTHKATTPPSSTYLSSLPSPSSKTYTYRPLRPNLRGHILEGLEAPSLRDIELAENVLQFARHLRISMCTNSNNVTAQVNEIPINDEPDVCPTCLEGNVHLKF